MLKQCNFQLITVILSCLLWMPLEAQAGPLKILSIEGLDDGAISESSVGTPSLDIIQDNCGEEDEPIPEAFNDTLVRVTVLNSSNASVKFDRLRYTVSNPYGSGGRLRSKPFALVGSGIAAGGDEITKLYGLFLDINNGRKSYAGYSSVIPDDLGFRNVTFFLSGKDSRGKRFSVRARTAFSFDNFDRCQD